MSRSRDVGNSVLATVKLSTILAASEMPSTSSVSIDKEFCMPKSYFIPTADHDFLVWFDHFVSNLSSNIGVSETNLNALKAANADYHAKTANASQAAALAKQAVGDKSSSRQAAENLIRAEAKRIKARADYTANLGKQLGIEGTITSNDLDNATPTLTASDRTGGVISLSFTKYHSDGINVYSQRDNDSDWLLLGRATVSPFIDSRPLLQTGKPELRRYTAIYMSKDKEIGKFSNDLVVSCAP